MKKDNLLLILLLLAIGVIVWLSLRKKEDAKINYEPLQEMLKESEQRFFNAVNEIKHNQIKYEKDSTFIYSADRDQRDSIRSIHNPR